MSYLENIQANKPASFVLLEAECPLNRLNQIGLEANALVKKSITEEIGKKYPVILVKGDNLIFLCDGKRSEVRYVPEHYHNLKAICHIPMALYSFSRLASENPSAPVSQHYQEFRELYKQIKTSVLKNASNWEEEYGHILDTISEAMPEELKDLKSRQELGLLFQRSLISALNKAIEKAAYARLEGLSTQIKAFKLRASEETWNRLSIVVMGVADAEVGELAMQYFAHVFKPDKPAKSLCPFQKLSELKPQEQRVLYATTFDETKAIERLVARIFDDQIGDVVFGNSEIMHADILSKPTQQLLTKQFYN